MVQGVSTEPPKALLWVLCRKSGGVPIFCGKEGNGYGAGFEGKHRAGPGAGELQITEQGYLVLEDGVIRGVYDRLPLEYATAPLVDYGQALVMQSFADMHLHAPQYPMLGMGMDLPLLEWLDTYTFPTEARFADTDYARRIYRRLATDLITNGTTRVCMFSSLHTDATWILMEELERAGVTG